MRVNVNPEAQASGEFGYAAAGDATLRCVEATVVAPKAGKEWGYVQWKFEFADPNTESVEKNPDGSSKRLGNVFHITTLKPDAQFALRDTCEALGLTWGDFDTDEVKGLEATANVGLETYNGKIKNVVERWKKN